MWGCQFPFVNIINCDFIHFWKLLRVHIAPHSPCICISLWLIRFTPVRTHKRGPPKQYSYTVCKLTSQYILKDKISNHLAQQVYKFWEHLIDHCEVFKFQLQNDHQIPPPPPPQLWKQQQKMVDCLDWDLEIIFFFIHFHPVM